MPRVCREVDQWIQQNVEQPVTNWVTQTQQQCAVQPCNWWCLCCNKWLCWLVTVLVAVVTFIVVTVTRLVTRVVCEIVSAVLDLVALFVNLVLSIPGVGGIIRTVLNWLSEIAWRLAGLPDFLLSLLGVQIPKKIYLKLIILNNNGTPLTTEAAVLPAISAAQAIYRTQCNINVIYTGACFPKLASPSSALFLSCDAGGFFSDWGIGGSYYELVSADCAYEDGGRRVIGYGGEIIGFIIQNVTPDSPGFDTWGCSFGATHNYFVEEAANLGTIAHEMGHVCGLLHFNDVTNLMNPFFTPTSVSLTTWQRAIVRNSRHCTFL